MNRTKFNLSSRKLLGLALMGLFILAMLGLSYGVALARPPAQEGGQPDFTVTSQTAPDGRAAIQSQEASLDHAYFASSGSKEGLELTPAGLILAAEETQGMYVSEVIHSPLAFTTDIAPLWQVDRPEDTGIGLETRLSLDGENWSEWLENPEAFYPVREEMHAGHLIWIGSESTALQFRLTLRRANPELLSPTVHNVTLVFNDTSAGPTDGEIAGLMANRAAEVEAAQDICPVKPEVVSRTEWGCPDGQDSPRRPPVYRPVTHIIIHQAETLNHTDPYHDWAGWVRSVWNYHTNVLWWGDVGYNYLLDPTGVIYEGRAGGDDVVGIHDGHNEGSLAVGFLGCYGACDDPRLSVVEPPEVMLAEATRLMAWKLGQINGDPFGSGPYGGLADVPVIAGGRDVTWTTSPGDLLYERLPDLREMVQARLDECQTSLPSCRVADITFDQPEYQVNDPIQLTVKLVDAADQPLGGAQVTFDVEISPAVASLAGAASFDMIDRTGDYDGVYTDTAVAGDYLFKILATDPTSTTFSACTAEKTVTVTGPPLPACTITALAEPAGPVGPGDPVNLVAGVALAGQPVSTATVTAQVTRPEGSGVAGVNLPWQSGGVYSQTFSDTTTLGDYHFSVAAAGQGFAPCQAEGAFSVEPEGPIVIIQPSLVSLCEAGSPATTRIKVAQVAGMQGFAFKLGFDPNVVGVADADPGTPDQVEIRVGPDLEENIRFTAKNEVNNGLIDFGAVLVDSFAGDTILAEIDWIPVGQGNSGLIFSEVKLSDPDGRAISHQVFGGAVEVGPCQGLTVSGQVYAQGRDNHQGVVISAGSAGQTETGPDGAFTINAHDLLTLKLKGYLSARADVQAQSNGGSVNLGKITLLAGDANNDNLIDIFDLAYLATRYDSVDSTADINADGAVDILDLALAAGNYGRQGPLSDWQ